MLKVDSMFVALALTAAPIAAQDFLESVPWDVMRTIGDLLPEQSNAGAAFISNDFSPNLSIVETCTVDIVFVWEGAGFYNSFGYFTYEESANGSVTILSSDLIIENASFPSSGSMQTGQGFNLKDGSGAARVFQPGEKIGFFVIADGYRSASQVTNWTYSMPGVPSNSARRNSRIGYGLYTSIGDINPEAARGTSDKQNHVAMIRVDGSPGFLGGNPFFLVGFEDLNRARGSDDDFNDFICIARASSVTAVDTSQIYTHAGNDPDNDGVHGANDDFPNDPTRATLRNYPSDRHTILALEDNYPEIGDGDYNDAVFAYWFEVVSNADGDITDIIGTTSLVARGATYEAALGLHLPGVPDDATGTIELERFLAGIGGRHDLIQDRTVADFVRNGKRIDDLFESMIEALPPEANSAFTNTETVLAEDADPNAAMVRVRFSFDRPIPASALGTKSLDFYLLMDRYGDGIWDIHQAGWPSFEGRASHLPVEAGDEAFVNAEGNPFALELPGRFQFPLERSSISKAYPEFDEWRRSRGKSRASWYLNPTTTDGTIAGEASDLIPYQNWTVGVPAR